MPRAPASWAGRLVNARPAGHRARRRHAGRPGPVRGLSRRPSLTLNRSSIGGRISSRPLPSPRAREAADERGGHPLELAEDEVGGRGQLVGDGHGGRPQLVPGRVDGARVAPQRGRGRSRRWPCRRCRRRSARPIVSATTTASRAPVAARATPAAGPGGGVRVGGEQDRQPAPVVRAVDARARAHEAVVGLGDQEDPRGGGRSAGSRAARARPYGGRRPRPRAPPPGRRCHRRQVDDPALLLADRLVGRRRPRRRRSAAGRRPPAARPGRRPG